MKAIFQSKQIWLVTWLASTVKKLEGLGCKYIVSFIDIRTQDAVVLKITTAMYVALYPFTVFERAIFATKSEYKRTLKNYPGSAARIGLNPWLYVRAVADFKIYKIDDDFNVSWREPIAHYEKPDKRGGFNVSCNDQEYMLDSSGVVLKTVKGHGFTLV